MGAFDKRVHGEKSQFGKRRWNHNLWSPLCPCRPAIPTAIKGKESKTTGKSNESRPRGDALVLANECITSCTCGKVPRKIQRGAFKVSFVCRRMRKWLTGDFSGSQQRERFHFFHPTWRLSHRLPVLTGLALLSLLEWHMVQEIWASKNLNHLDALNYTKLQLVCG